MALNQAAINIEVINGVPPAKLYNQAVTASSTSTSSFLKKAGAIRSALSTSAVNLVRGVGKLVTYTSTSAVSILRAITQTARTVTSTSTVSITKAVNHLFSTITSISSSTLARVAGKLVVASESTVNSISRAVGKFVVASEVTVSNIYKLLPKTYSASSTSTANVLKTVGKTLVSAIEYTVALIAEKANHFVTLSYNSVTTSSIAKLVNKLITDVEVSIAVILEAANHLLTLLAYSTSTVNISKAVSHTVTAISTSIANVFKQVQKTFITLGNKYVMTGGLNGSVFNLLAINTDAPVYTETTGVTSNTTISVNSVYHVLISIVEATVNSLTAFRILPRTYTVVSTSIVNLVKQAQTTLYNFEGTSVNISTAITRLQALIASVTSTVTIVSAKFFYKTLAVLSTTVTTLTNTANKLLVSYSTNQATLVKQVGKVFTVVLSSITSILTNLISFTKYVNGRLIYVANRVTTVATTKTRQLYISAEALRSVAVTKIRTLFITKDDIK